MLIPRLTRAVPAVVTSLLVAAACAGPASAADWSPSVPSLTGGGNTLFSAGVAVDRTGAVAATWWDFDNNTLRATVKPAGGTFAAPQTLGVPGDRSPEIAIDSQGDALVAWEQGVGGISVAERKAGNASFGSLGIFAATGDSPSVGVTADGTAIVAWTAGTQALASVRKPGGTFSAPVIIGQGAGETEQAKVATNPASNEAVVVWGATVGQTVSVKSSVRPAGGTFAGQQQVDATTYGAGIKPGGLSDLDVAMGPSGRVEAAWITFGITGQMTSDDLLKVNSRASGAASTWSAAKQVDNTSGDVIGDRMNDPHAVALDSGAGRAIWQFRASLGTSSAARTASHTAGGPYSAYSVVASSAAQNTRIQQTGAAALPGDRTLGLWTIGDVLVSAQATGTGGFGTTKPILSGTGILDSFAVRGDGTGDAAAIAVRNGKLFVPLYDATAPELRNVVIPATATIGTPVTFSATAFDGLTSASTPTWDYGDGTTATGASVNHAFATAGTFTVTVSTTDTAGNPVSKSSTVTVPAAPTTTPAPATGTDAPADTGGAASSDAPSGADASSSGDSGSGAAGAVGAPVVTGFAITPKKFTVGHKATAVSARRRGAAFRYTLSADAKVAITLRRVGKGKAKRAAAAGVIARTSKQGANRVAFTGRVGKRALRRGTYRATIVATTAAGDRSAASTLSFKIR